MPPKSQRERANLGPNLCARTKKAHIHILLNENFNLKPCRGTNPELKLDPTNSDFNDELVEPTSGFLSSEPNREDIIIFYATVESTLIYELQ
jgi:hypothetical protein